MKYLYKVYEIKPLKLNKYIYIKRDSKGKPFDARKGRIFRKRTQSGNYFKFLLYLYSWTKLAEQEKKEAIIRFKAMTLIFNLTFIHFNNSLKY